MVYVSALLAVYGPRIIKGKYVLKFDVGNVFRFKKA